MEKIMKTEGSGLCPKRLKNVEAYLTRIVDQGKAAGAGGMIVRHGVQAFCASAGWQDLARKVPMKNDSIYRIYSMSKTFTIAAAMTLYEKAFFRLHQPIADFIPAFKEMKVAETDNRGIMRLAPANKPITFEHLFTMTSGIPYPGAASFPACVMADIDKRAHKDAAGGAPWNTARMVEEAAAAPLCFHPGEQWMYGFSHDVLGRLIEVISGKTLGAYLQETIFDPLGLRDTAFYVPPEKQSRLAAPYRPGPNGLEEETGLSRDPASPEAPVFESGGGGLCSTMADCARYALMLLHNGALEGRRILSRKTLELIRVNHCDLAERARSGFPHMLGYGYGLGVRTMVDTARAGLNGSPGEWAWDGMLGTWYCVDPAEDMIALFFIQLMSDYNAHLQRGFAQAAYSAIDD
jgi:CubicO group peptidase (beta-lactamase class C family)